LDKQSFKNSLTADLLRVFIIATFLFLFLFVLVRVVPAAKPWEHYDRQENNQIEKSPVQTQSDLFVFNARESDTDRSPIFDRNFVTDIWTAGNWNIVKFNDIYLIAFAFSSIVFIVLRLQEIITKRPRSSLIAA
jgi:hypothetical protein